MPLTSAAAADTSAPLPFWTYALQQPLPGVTDMINQGQNLFLQKLQAIVSNNGAIGQHVPSSITWTTKTLTPPPTDNTFILALSTWVPNYVEDTYFDLVYISAQDCCSAVSIFQQRAKLITPDDGKLISKPNSGNVGVMVWGSKRLSLFDYKNAFVQISALTGSPNLDQITISTINLLMDLVPK